MNPPGPTPHAGSPAVEVALRSDPGRDPEKQVNEDACAEEATRFGHLVVVCDGMGGHAGGREASELAVRTIREVFAQAAEGTAPRDVLAQAIREANHRVFVMTTPEETGGGGGRPGSTAVAALVTPEGTEIAHVGDSRAYLVHGGQIFQLTKDHSMVQRLVDEGLLSPQDAMRHPEANKILRALGVASEVDVDVRAQPVAHVTGDAIILCSDGLSDLVPPEDILGVAGSAPAAQAAGQLVDLANARGGHDNITVAIVRPRASATAVRREPLPPTVPQTLVHAPMPTVMQMPAPPPPPPSAGQRPETGRRRAAIRIIAVLVALVGVAVAGFAFYLHESQRRGARRKTPSIATEPLPSHTGHPEIELVPMASAPMPVPPADEDSGLVPLAPLAPLDAGRHRRKPGGAASSPTPAY